jgi:serine/threonine protein kinase
MHRDLKPANVMVGAFGEVQVMDWGLAREVRSADAASRGRERPESDAPPVAHAPGAPVEGTVMREVRFADEEYTRAGTVLGTPAYMAPEQAAADPDAIDVRADVFGLGAILCTILTGHPPYSGKDVNEVVLKALRWDKEDAFRRLAQCKAETEVIDLCKRCLAKDPAKRPADGEAVAKELARLRATAAERLKEAELTRAEAVTKRQELRKRVWLGVGAAVVIIGLIGFGWWYRDDMARAQAKADRDASDEQERLKAEKGKAEKLQRRRSGPPGCRRRPPTTTPG